MSLEDAINRLASAAERHYSNSAVAEIIRQRDEAITRCDQECSDKNFFKSSRNDYQQMFWKEQRRNAALRGVITRMKKARIR